MNKESTSKASQTDWGRVKAMRDEGIDLSDIPEVTEGQMEYAFLRVDGQPVPKGKVCVPMVFDREIVEYFKTRGGEHGYERLIVDVLEAYIREHESSAEGS